MKMQNLCDSDKLKKAKIQQDILLKMDVSSGAVRRNHKNFKERQN
jgi:hypothetical protein